MPRTHPSMWRYSALGAALALTAPAGWWLWMAVTRGWSGAAEDLLSHAPLYAYLLIGTMVAFAMFGAILGRLNDRLRTANTALREQAITDALTGLRNSRYFHERIAQECARSDRDGTPLGLIMVDLDRFKEINDVFGHAFGDRVLAQAAGIMQRTARVSDVVCRVGGEEFAVLCPGTLLEDALAVAERIRSALERHEHAFGNHRAHLTASFGVAVRWPDTSAEAIYQAADQALYQAKALGRNRVVPVHPVLVRGPADRGTHAQA